MSEKLLAGATSASVKKHTKKDWDQWIAILNKKSCQALTHQQLVAALKKEFKLTTWWQQIVARGYQIAIGVRPPNQTLKGTYTTTATKTLTGSAQDIFSFLVSEEGQSIWLTPLYPVNIKDGSHFEVEGGVFGEFRTVKKNKSLRLSWINEDWPKKTIVQLHLIAKAKGRCMIAIDHSDLPTMRAKTEMHTRWRTAVDTLATLAGKNF
jgi:activator of HSP90 ATPase